MANPEVALSAHQAEDGHPSVAKEVTEKKPNNDSSSSVDRDDVRDEDQEIAWHYLTFETDLPSPAHLALPADALHGRPPAPQCPSLRDYVSPFLWSERRKKVMTYMSVCFTVLTAYAAGSYSAGIDQMMREWHVSEVALEVGITVFTCGFGIAPMVLAPFSEINGRRPVFVATGLLFVAFQLTCALTPTYPGMLVARFLAGCMGSTFSTMVGGVVSDIYHAEDRNTAMSLFSASALLGTGLGPLISGFLAQHTTWRWIFYFQVIVDGVSIVGVLFLFKETRGSVLLSRKAKALNRWYAELEAAGYTGVMWPSPSDPGKLTPQRIRWKVKADEERGSLLRMIRISVHRPFHMLFTEPVIFAFSLWLGFSWCVLYLTLSAIPLIFATTYDFNLEQYESIFTAMVAASIIFAFVAIYQEKLARRYLPSKRELFESPEGRLVFACAESALLPIGCLWFCISGAYPGVPWIVPALGLGCATMGIFSIYLAGFNYLADSYHRYASSALAAQSFCRNMLGGSFPLFTKQMFKAMTFQGAGGFLGGFGLLLTIVPWVLLLYGPRIRAKSKLAGELLKD